MLVAVFESDPPGTRGAGAKGSASGAPPDPRIAAAANGDRAAAQALLLELLPRVRNLVRYLARGDADVDDLAQLALCEILRSFGGFRHEGSLGSFVDRITVRVALRQLKQRRNERARLDAAQPDLRAVSSQPGQPDEHTLRRETAKLLDALPSEQREAVVLHHVVGLSVPELAAELGIPFETARSRLRLGVQKLRERFAVTESES
jgi:RNA polymerase sigma-70 factor (ECF subfamily)